MPDVHWEVGGRKDRPRAQPRLLAGLDPGVKSQVVAVISAEWGQSSRDWDDPAEPNNGTTEHFGGFAHRQALARVQPKLALYLCAAFSTLIIAN